MLTVDDIIALNNKKNEVDSIESRHECYRRFGFDDRGVTYIAIENLNTMERQLEFRNNGGFYDKIIGWHSKHRIAGFLMKSCKFDDVCINRNGRWFTQKYLVDKVRKETAVKNLGKRDLSSEFVGEVRQDIIIKARLVKMYETAFDNPDYDFGGSKKRWDMIFKDSSGNIFKFTTCWYDYNRVIEFCGKAWLNITAKVISHVYTYGRKETKIGYPTIMRGKKYLKDYARIKKNECVACESVEERNVG